MTGPVRTNHLFELYISNKATEAEVAELFDLLQHTSSNAQLNPELAALWESINPKNVTSEPNWAQMYQNVTRNNPDETPVAKIGQKHKLYYYTAAAAVFIGVFLALLFTVLQKPSTNYITYTVPFKTTHTIVLDDGSKVVLNAGTTLKYPQHFTGKTREVSINGEGFFQVKHLTDKPFIVHSGKLQTQVLGTSFNVNAYTEAATAKVTVLTGKVAVKEASTGKQVMLAAREQATLNDNRHTFKKTVSNDTPAAIAWQDDKLVFDEATLEDIALQLKLKFGVQTTLANPKLRNCKVSAVFQHKTLTEILDVVTRLTNATYTLKQQALVISGKGCND